MLAVESRLREVLTIWREANNKEQKVEMTFTGQEGGCLVSYVVTSS